MLFCLRPTLFGFPPRSLFLRAEGANHCLVGLQQRAVEQFNSTGMDPLVLADKLLEAMEDGRFLVVPYEHGARMVELAYARFPLYCTPEGMQKLAEKKAAPMTEEEKNAWSVIGSINGTMWDTDFALAATGDGLFESEPMELHAGEEFKVRQGAGWDVNYGANGEAGGANIVVEADGTYKIHFEEATGMITLVPAN